LGGKKDGESCGGTPRGGTHTARMFSSILVTRTATGENIRMHNCAEREETRGRCDRKKRFGGTKEKKVIKGGPVAARPGTGFIAVARCGTATRKEEKRRRATKRSTSEAERAGGELLGRRNRAAVGESSARFHSCPSESEY